jgi:hypothetical protein
MQTPIERLREISSELRSDGRLATSEQIDQIIDFIVLKSPELSRGWEDCT